MQRLSCHFCSSEIRRSRFTFSPDRSSFKYFYLCCLKLEIIHALIREKRKWEKDQGSVGITVCILHLVQPPTKSHLLFRICLAWRVQRGETAYSRADLVMRSAGYQKECNDFLRDSVCVCVCVYLYRVQLRGRGLLPLLA